ncbi:hypothetical protein F5B19DRAFT_4623 [Rostrohypoxylon terebratum]|nr:hypothetical protein F5B19DRAFT_4623 [Rostrohypoxylon terebratum]
MFLNKPSVLQQGRRYQVYIREPFPVESAQGRKSSIHPLHLEQAKSIRFHFDQSVLSCISINIFEMSKMPKMSKSSQSQSGSSFSRGNRGWWQRGGWQPYSHPKRHTTIHGHQRPSKRYEDDMARIRELLEKRFEFHFHHHFHSADDNNPAPAPAPAKNTQQYPTPSRSTGNRETRGGTPMEIDEEQKIRDLEDHISELSLQIRTFLKRLAGHDAETGRIVKFCVANQLELFPDAELSKVFKG